MRHQTMIGGCVIGGLMALAAGAWAQSVESYGSNDPGLQLATVAVEGGRTVTFTLGIGSGAFRHPGDPPMTFLGIADRGPNFLCEEAMAVLGVDGDKLCAGVEKARIYPVPEYTPSIYTIELKDDGSFAVTDVIPLKDRDGNPIDGMLNPLTVATTENPVDATGRRLEQNPNAVDAEALVKLSDGTFWIADENAPSILHVAADGRILTRVVPAGTEGDFAGADYEIVGGLPELFARRATNRGLESLAISPDERFLYLIMQNPLANPDNDAYKAAKNTRILKIERETLRQVGEYVYQLDDPQSFRLDPSDKQNAPRISEMIALGPDRLLVLERTGGTTKLYEIALAGATDILGSDWDAAATSPSLEQSNDVARIGVTPVAKTLRFDSADVPDAPTKIEGIAILGDGAVALINDNDFGITGAVTRVIVLKGSGIVADTF